jgi:hypothetical protein
MADDPDTEIIGANDERRNALDHFGKSSTGLNGSAPPGVRALSAPVDRVFGAQAVAVYRDEAKVLQRIRALAAAAGGEWFYRFPVKSKGATSWIEGPSIKLANDLARIYGNCDVDIRVYDVGDSLLFYARFTDFETGYSLTRPFQQRKNQATMGSGERQADIAFQIGASKAIRNVVVNALQTFADFAFDEARSALVDKVKSDPEKYRTGTIAGIAREEIDIRRVEQTIGRASKDWLVPDIARIIAMMKAIKDGMATVDETFPPIEGAAEEPTPPAPTPKPRGRPRRAAASDADAPIEEPKPAPEPPSEPIEEPEEQEPEQEKQAPPPVAEPPQQPIMPQTEAQYLAFANAWREAITTQEQATEAGKRWGSLDEKNIRNRCNVTEEVRDSLREKLLLKIDDVRGALR